MREGDLSFESHVARVRAAYEAFNRGDFAVLLGWFAPDVRWQRRESHPMPSTYQGRESVLRDVLYTIHEQFGEIQFEPLEVFEHRDHIVVRLRQRGRGRSSGVVVEGELAHTLRLDDDGQLLELRAFDTVDEAIKALDAGTG
jgi:ketosteroid isomerase-like protein